TSAPATTVAKNARVSSSVCRSGRYVMAARAARKTFATASASATIARRGAGIGRSLRRQNAPVLDLFPQSASLDRGELTVGGVRATALAEEFGTPLVVYCEQTILA